MRKLKLQMQTSIDGYVSTGPNDEQAWVTWALDQIRPRVLSLAGSADTILIGRKLAVDYIPYWLDVVKDPHHEVYDIGQHVVRMKKVVFSRTMEKSIWPNTEVANGELVAEVKKLKDQAGRDMMVYGGSAFVSSLIRERLIDEFNFFVNPVALGKGDHVFNQLTDFYRLKLKECTRYQSGIVLMVYEPDNHISL